MVAFPVVFSGSLNLFIKNLGWGLVLCVTGAVTIQVKHHQNPKKKNTRKSSALHSSRCERCVRSRWRATTQKKYDNKPGNGECLRGWTLQGVSLHPQLLKVICVALLKCVKTMSYTDYGFGVYNATSVSCVCSENASWHGRAVRRAEHAKINNRHVICNSKDTVFRFSTPST
jgi:hypothetical protein